MEGAHHKTQLISFTMPYTDITSRTYSGYCSSPGINNRIWFRYDYTQIDDNQKTA